jgi:hypothetical protein
VGAFEITGAGAEIGSGRRDSNSEVECRTEAQSHLKSIMWDT